MVLCVKVPLKHAQEVKAFLVEKRLFSPDYSFRKDGSSIFFPITDKNGIKKRFSYVDFEECSGLRPSRKSVSLKSSVAQHLSKEETSILRRAFDIVGSIAILEVPPELERKERILAETLLKLQKNVKTVVKKAGIHETEFRTQPMKYLAGVDTKETVHKESGVLLRLDIEKVYFSPRLANERERIAKQIRPGESVLVMFSGCAPYPCVIAKNSKAKEIVGIELNPEGHRYGLENIRLNKLRNITLINEDVNSAAPKLGRKFDRIIMPLPKSAGDFLDSAFAVSKKGTVIHFYAFEEEGKFDAAEKRVFEACRKNGLRCDVMKVIRCGQQSPSVFRICVDFRIN
jgi:tRNA (guanine37-N1)-methyltransferase